MSSGLTSWLLRSLGNQANLLAIVSAQLQKGAGASVHYAAKQILNAPNRCLMLACCVANTDSDH